MGVLFRRAPFVMSGTVASLQQTRNSMLGVKPSLIKYPKKLL
jgi:hypothetical protein